MAIAAFDEVFSFIGTLILAHLRNKRCLFHAFVIRK